MNPSIQTRTIRAKRDESGGETFSLKGTLADYEVAELDAHQAVALLAKRRPGMGSQGHAPSLRLVQTATRV